MHLNFFLNLEAQPIEIVDSSLDAHISQYHWTFYLQIR